MHYILSCYPIGYVLPFNICVYLPFPALVFTKWTNSWPPLLVCFSNVFNPDTTSKATYVDKAYRAWNKTIRNWDATVKLIMTPCLSLPGSSTHRIADNIFKFALTPIIQLLMGAIIGQQRCVPDFPPFPVEFLHLTGP